jgi:hypothetical protein
MHARYYHPALGRFVSADTIVPEPGNPQDLNRYSYTRNNPVRYTDPSGHFIFAPILLAAGIALLADYAVQVHHNRQQGLSWGEAVYHENLNEVEMVAAGVAGGTGAALAGPALAAVPAFVETVGITGLAAPVAEIGLSAVVGGGASVAGEFGGRVWQNSMYQALDESTRVDLWDASTYTSDMAWGMVSAGTLKAIDVAFMQPAIAGAEARVVSEFKGQAASELWDWTAANGGIYPPGAANPQSDRGLDLYLRWVCGPNAEQLASGMAPYVMPIKTAGQAAEILLNDDALEKLYPIE